MSGRRILDVLNMPADICLHSGVLEHTVASRIDGTVLQHEVVCVAEQLLTRQVTIHEPHVLRVPGQILTVEQGVIDRHVLALPEGVLRHDLSMVYLHVLAVLKHVLRVALQSVDIDVLREHEGIGALVQLDIPESEAVDLPESLVGIIDHHILQLHVAHLTEELRPVDGAVAHHQVVGVPDGRARARGEVAAFDTRPVDVPPGVLAIELAIVALHPLALLDARLPINDGDILQPQVVGGEQGALAPEFLVLY